MRKGTARGVLRFGAAAVATAVAIIVLVSSASAASAAWLSFKEMNESAAFMARHSLVTSAAGGIDDPVVTMPDVTDKSGKKYGLDEVDSGSGMAPSALCAVPSASPSPEPSPSSEPGEPPSGGAELAGNESASPLASPSVSADPDCLKWPSVSFKVAKDGCKIMFDAANDNPAMVPFQLWVRIQPGFSPLEVTALLGAWFPANYSETGDVSIAGAGRGTLSIWFGLWHGTKQQLTFGELKGYKYDATGCPRPTPAVAVNSDGSPASQTVQMQTVSKSAPASPANPEPTPSSNDHSLEFTPGPQPTTDNVSMDSASENSSTVMTGLGVVVIVFWVLAGALYLFLRRQKSTPQV